MTFQPGWGTALFRRIHAGTLGCLAGVGDLGAPTICIQNGLRLGAV
ncbi:MAG: hypothetical protein OXG82_04350 [Gammaproteobacteria bacterium]|nr:hypothetical protein [Gammaproteobacteria bacterium]